MITCTHKPSDTIPEMKYAMNPTTIYEILINQTEQKKEKSLVRKDFLITPNSTNILK